MNPDHDEISKALDLLRGIQESLTHEFVARSEVIRVLLVSAIAQEHVLLVGPPGTAKSGLLRTFARLCDARYFEYLLTRFSEPNELFGPVDIPKFRDGVYERRIEGMLPTAEIAFLDEIFKANSAILNSLLTLLNERVYVAGSQRVDCPLLCLLGATNEMPTDDSLAAVLDRFLLRIPTPNLEPIHFQALLQVGWQAERGKLQARSKRPAPMLTSRQLRTLNRELAEYEAFPSEFLATYKDLILRLRNEGVPLSDRRIVKLLKIFAANALLDGRPQVNASDLGLLRHAWSHPEQLELIESILEPELESFYERNPTAPRPGAALLDFEKLVHELERTAARLTGKEALADVELFAHLRSLHDLKAAFQTLATPAARERVAYLDRLLGFLYQNGPNPNF